MFFFQDVHWNYGRGLTVQYSPHAADCPKSWNDTGISQGIQVLEPFRLRQASAHVDRTLFEMLHVGFVSKA